MVSGGFAGHAKSLPVVAPRLAMSGDLGNAPDRIVGGAPRDGIGS
jgi:hypothetical protein